MPFSYSHLSAYRHCPRHYEYAFVKKLPQPRSAEISFGVAMHSCLAKWGKEEMKILRAEEREGQAAQQSFFQESASVRPIEITMELLLDFWNASFITDGYDSAAAADFNRARGERLLTQFYEWWKKEKRKVMGVEKSFRIQMKSLETARLGGSASAPPPRSVPPPTFVSLWWAQRDDMKEITGRFDRVEELPDGSLRIIDWKTGSLRSQAEVDQDLQLSLYALAAKEVFHKEVVEVIMLFLADEEVVEITTARTTGELQTAATTIRLLTERITSADFTPTPSQKKCSKCPYRRVCDVAALE